MRNNSTGRAGEEYVKFREGTERGGKVENFRVLEIVFFA